MVAVRALFDTNILIDYLKGIRPALVEVDRYGTRAVSIVTWIELMAGLPAKDQPAVRKFLNTFALLPLTSDVAERTVIVRREQKVKLPDAIILATALVEGCLLVTRNTRDFPAEEGVIRVPYTL